MFIFDADDYFKGIVTVPIIIICVVCLIGMSSTIYIDIGKAMGLTVLGIIAVAMLVISSIYNIVDEDNAKWLKILCIIQLITIIVLAIYGFLNPARIDTIEYANWASIFVTPIIFYLILFAINFICHYESIVAAGISIIFIGITAVAIGIIIIGAFWFAKNDGFLKWAGNNFRYYVVEAMEERIQAYGTDNFEEILSKELSNLKTYYNDPDHVQFGEEYKVLSDEEIKEKFLQDAKHKGDYRIYEYRLLDYKETDEEGIYIAQFIDDFQVDQNNNFPIYNCKIDFNTYTLVEMLDSYE